LGARLTRKVDVRVIAATNRNLEMDVHDKTFRRDLYYRLAAFPIHIPCLRERLMDILVLAGRILADTAKGFGKEIAGFAPEALRLLAGYDWPGNVREMMNEIQRMVALAEAPLMGPELLSPRLRTRTVVGSPAGDQPLTLKDRVESLEAEILAEALARHGGNVSRVALEMGLSRVGLRAKMARYGLERQP
jgi:two-component system response regulator HupR/HoxA